MENKGATVTIEETKSVDTTKPTDDKSDIPENNDLESDQIDASESTANEAIKKGNDESSTEIQVKHILKNQVRH